MAIEMLLFCSSKLVLVTILNAEMNAEVCIWSHIAYSSSCNILPCETGVHDVGNSDASVLWQAG